MTKLDPRTDNPVLRYVLAAAVAILIAYGSLYPFVFHDAGPLSTDLAHFLASWRDHPQSRGDILANLLLYAPLGLTATLAFEQSMSRFRAAILAGVCAAALSFCIELAQFYDASRVSAFSDFALNLASAVAGIVLALTAGARLIRTSWPAGSAPGFARLLLLAWLGWRLYPFVPTLEIRQFWRSLQPVLFMQGLNVDEFLRYAVLWLSVIFLFRVGVRPSMAALLAAMLAFFAAKASIIGQVISLPELLGAILAFLFAPLVLGRFSSAGLLLTAALLLLAVILNRILPWQFTPVPKSFQWIPFYSFLHGSPTVDAISFAQKFYLYGATLLLLVKAGFGLRLAIALECAILFATSLLQTFMVGRSAEISDAVLALILGLVYALLRRLHHEGARPSLAAVPQMAEQES